MAVRFHSVVVDALDPAALARFWAQVLGWDIIEESDDEVVVARDEHSFPVLVFGTVPERKTTKNRLHLALAPDDRDGEVERILSLGATRQDVGQGSKVSWIVLADPEGNEFCVLSSRNEGM